jgi:DNA-binding MarR family transcriptional regulator
MEDAARAAGAAGATATEDAVASVLRQWQQVHPDLDFAPVAVIGRLNRCTSLLQQVADAPLGREGLTRPEYEILCALSRVGGELTPGRLARETFASGAAVTKRIKQLEQRDLVSRRPDNRDRRVSHLSLTPTGRDLVDRLLPEQLDYETTLLSGLPSDRRQELAAILADLLLLLEGRLGSLTG